MKKFTSLTDLIVDLEDEYPEAIADIRKTIKENEILKHDLMARDETHASLQKRIDFWQGLYYDTQRKLK
jgi:hypothetical protein